MPPVPQKAKITNHPVAAPGVRLRSLKTMGFGIKPTMVDKTNYTVSDESFYGIASVCYIRFLQLKAALCPEVLSKEYFQIGQKR